MHHLNHIEALFPMIYLASASPRRHELLKQIGITHEILQVPQPLGEDEPQLPNELAQDYVQRTALEKALRAKAYIEEQELWVRPILSADTCVILNNQVLGKPVDASHAARILGQLSGKTHEVHTAVVLAYRQQLLKTVSITQVTMRPLSVKDIALYVQSGEYDGKAGAYGIQGLASVFIEKIEGSYSGVMGLPLYETWNLLQQLGR
ncbi:septum formation inhibitor Maf [Pelistega sp. NLN82]|uniref:dTTP/UTP pyrophosphatase n=1 Tax=Pelistega ratti TaxID=2652177 RepID=A0A6L9Y4E2_9BURK|nr:nucleoside triphosphate pyrophosphatase [Pelistega ratti]NEN75055.1 septum formation inhibitor Maf [Pelistega ratti]